ncbi:choline-sulfatase [Ascodesmis nigricans]|uniref:Choline-sulfatase n=1 Tax=Ascodesmis nigricans TaxID=341454 RepID=A0A4V3SIE4_9PEZI|nr:choline-sulfatase [Ascodesmis nigricans]
MAPPDLNTVPPSPHPPINATHSPPPNVALPLHPAPPVASPERPNILYIMADQLAAPLLKMHNPDSQIKTPNIDRLASDAVVFDSAYCPSPLCAPSRMSMVTGQLPSKIGAYDNANSIGSDIPTYAHYLRSAGYETVLAGKMHFIGEQLHGYERRLTSDIYPGDYGWVVDWDEPDTRLEWYHNASSILQAGVCVRSNQLDYDEEVMYRSTQYLYDHVRKPVRVGEEKRPFCLTVSLTHPHDPYTIEQKYWDMYEDVDIPLPTVSRLPNESQDAHSARLMKVCDLWDKEFTPEQIKRARRAYYGAVSYVDDCIGRILKVLKDCKLDENTIIVFSGDHGDMLGERGLWYKMSYFESSVRVPFMIHHPTRFPPRHIPQHVSTLDILPTLTAMVGVPIHPSLQIDGHSLLPLLESRPIPPTFHDSNTVFAEYMGEGTVAPLIMIRRGTFKYIHCPADPDQLYDLEGDPLELTNCASDKALKHMPEEIKQLTAEKVKLLRDETYEKWDFKALDIAVRRSQCQRRVVWDALKRGKWTSWDWNPASHGEGDGRQMYIRSHMPLDDLEIMARYPRVDEFGRVM